MTNEIESFDLLKILHRARYLSSTNVQVLESFIRKWSLSAYNSILKTQVLSETDLANALATSLDIDRAYFVYSQTIPLDVLRLISFREARIWECIPLSFTKTGENKILKLAVIDPTKIKFFSILQERLGCEIQFVIGEKSDVLRAINEFYAIEDQLPSLSKELT